VTAAPKGDDVKTIYALTGLPASGKSTIALDMVEREGVKRVNKDLLREMLHGGKYTPELEQFVIDVRDAIIELALRRGFDIVVDDTNLNPEHRKAIQRIADELEAQLTVIPVDTPLEVCIERDKKRARPIGEKVIRSMHEKYF
jgi:predicted kinase